MKQRKWRVLLSMVLAFCLCLSAVVPVSAAGVDFDDDGESFFEKIGKTLEEWFGAGDDDVGTQATGDESLQYRIVHLDCGRKYFSVANIRKLIDTMYQYGYNQLQLAFGNGGCRFLLDDMSLEFSSTSDTVKITSKDVIDGIISGNNAFNGDTRYLTQADMDAIIDYANSKNIEIVPMLNMPGHMEGILSSFSGYKDSNGNLDISNTEACNFAYALLTKYVKYFASKGCNFFHFGSDESKHSGTDMTNFLSKCANIISATKNSNSQSMTPRAFNDATKVATMPKNVEITYWTLSQNYDTNEITSETAKVLDNNGYKLINTHGRWYYVIKSYDKNDCSTNKYYIDTVNDSQVMVELPTLKATKMDSNGYVGINQYFDSSSTPYGSTISNSLGTMFCIWCDASQDSYLTDSDVISDNENYGALYQLKKLAEHYWADDIKSNPQVKQEDNSEIPASIVKGSRITLKADKAVTWTVTPETGVILISNNSGIKSDSVTIEAVGTGTATLTATDDEGFTSSYTIEVTADPNEPREETVSINVGESKTFDVASSVAAENIKTGNEYVATATINEGTAQAASVNRVSEISSGKKYLITINNRIVTNKFSSNGYTDKDYWSGASGLYIEDLGSINISNIDTLSQYAWTFSQNGNAWSVTDADGKYLCIGSENNNVTLSDDSSLLTVTDNGDTFDFSNGSFYLNNFGGDTYNLFASSWANGKSGWTLYEITEASSGSNTLTITGTGEGDTSATVGNVTYNITVTAVKTTVDKSLTYNSSFDLPEGATAEITSGSGVTLSDDGKVTAGESDADAIVTAAVTNKGGKITARYIYNVTVRAVDLSKVDPLPVELWVTNLPIGKDADSVTEKWNGLSISMSGNTTICTPATMKIAAVEAAYENGALLSDKVLSEGVSYENSGKAKSYSYLFWKGVVLHDGDKQYHANSSSTDKSDKSNSGTDFDRIRYYSDKWQYFANDEWNDVLDDDTIIAYYRQKFIVSNEIISTTRDWGDIAGDGGGTDGDPFDWGNPPLGYFGIGTAVVYLDKSMMPVDDDAIWNNTLQLRYVYSNNDPGNIIVYDTTDYKITKITITRGYHAQSDKKTLYTGTKKTWAKDDSVLWNKIENEAGDLWYDETTIWERPEDYALGKGIQLDETTWGTTWVTGSNDATAKTWTDYDKWSSDDYKYNEAFLLLFYVEPVKKEDNLTVVYWDDSNGNQINPNPIQISVKDGITFINGIKQKSNVNVGEFTLDDDATIENSVGVNQKFNKQISILDGVAQKYKSGVFKYVKADISEDGKTLTLHYEIDSDKVRALYVLDFGLPIDIKMSDIVENSGEIQNVTWDSSQLQFGELSYDNSTKTLTYNPTKILYEQAIMNFTLQYEDSTGKVSIGILPASNVYYEESFFTKDNKWEPVGEADSTRTQATEKLGESSNYGYDSAYGTDAEYSGGSALQASVSVEMANPPIAKFTFEGTGFDIVSECGYNTGLLYVEVTDRNGNFEKGYLADTYFGGDGTYIAKKNTAYQIPAVRCTDILNYGTHTVTIYGLILKSSGAVKNASLYNMDDSYYDVGNEIYAALENLGVTDEKLDNLEFVFVDENSILNGGSGVSTYSADTDSRVALFSDETSSTGNYYVYLDGFRVYNPLGFGNSTQKTTSGVYSDDNESGYKYVSALSLIQEADNERKLVYMETNTTTNASEIYGNYMDYRIKGPYNEVYLAPSQSIALSLTGDTSRIQISAKSVDGNPVTAVLGGTDSIAINTATEMYYDLTVADGLAVITNMGNSGVLSISEVKLPTDVESTDLSDADREAVVQIVSNLFAASTDPEPEEPETFEPEYLSAYTLPITLRRLGATITVTSSTESEMEVYIKAGENGKPEKLSPINSRMVRWGIADKYIYSYNTGRLASGDYTYYVYAVKDGIASEPIAVTFKAR